jgi:hypothetical protein
MTHPADQSPPADVCLLLRAHAEARWLSRELVPLVRELEHDRASELEEDLASAAAVAYLEVLAIEARRHATETDAARSELDALAPNGHHALDCNARRYHAAVRRLRAVVDRRVQLLLADADDAALDREHAHDAVPDAPTPGGLYPEHEPLPDGGRAGRVREAGRTHGAPLRRRARRHV